MDETTYPNRERKNSKLMKVKKEEKYHRSEERKQKKKEHKPGGNDITKNKKSRTFSLRFDANSFLIHHHFLLQEIIFLIFQLQAIKVIAKERYGDARGHHIVIRFP